MSVALPGASLPDTGWIRIFALALVALLAGGCAAQAVPITDVSQALPTCGGPSDALIHDNGECPKRTAAGLVCHLCYDYSACLAGHDEGLGYCVDKFLGCSDPVCAY